MPPKTGVQWTHNGQQYPLDRLPPRSEHRKETRRDASCRGAFDTQHSNCFRRRRHQLRISCLHQGFLPLKVFFRRPCDRAARVCSIPSPRRRIPAARAREEARPLSHPLPHGTPNTCQHVRERLLDQRIDDPVDRAPRDPRRDVCAQRRLQVDRPRLLPEDATETDNKFYSNSGFSPAPPSTTTTIRARFRASSLARPIQRIPEREIRKRSRTCRRSSGSPTAGTTFRATWRRARDLWRLLLASASEVSAGTARHQKCGLLCRRAAMAQK